MIETIKAIKDFCEYEYQEVDEKQIMDNVYNIDLAYTTHEDIEDLNIEQIEVQVCVNAVDSIMTTYYNNQRVLVEVFENDYSLGEYIKYADFDELIRVEDELVENLVFKKLTVKGVLV